MVLVRLGLSNQRKLPCIKLGKYALPLKHLNYWLFEFPYQAEHILGDRYLIWNNEHIFITDRINIFTEWSEWINDYAPPKEFKIKKIFDVGCDYGTTMLFFNKVYRVKNFNICDMNKEAIRLAQKNACLNDWNIDKVYSGEFNHKMLKDCDFDLLKIDVEGGEKELLKLKSIDYPVVLEVHSKKLMFDFKEKGFTLKRKRPQGKHSTFDGVFLMNNYESIGLEEKEQFEMKYLH